MRIFFFKGNLRNITNSLLYFGGSIVQLLISLFTFPIYAQYLSAEEFGIVGYYTSFIQFFTPLFVLSMTNVYIMKYFKQDDNKNGKLLFNLIFFLSLINTITYAISYIGLYFYFKIANVHIPFYPYAIIIFTTIFFDTFKTFTLLNYRIKKQALSFFILSSSGPILNAIFSVLLIIYFDQGAVGRLSGPMISKILIAIACIRILKGWIIKDIDFKVFKEAVYLAAPLIISSYAFIPIQSLDKILLERTGNISELGIYTIGSQIAGFLTLAFNAIYMAFEPDIYKYINMRNLRGLMKSISVYLMLIFLGIIVFLSFSSIVISLMTKDRYDGAVIYANIIAIGGGLMAIHQVTNSIILAHQKTRNASFIIFWGGAAAIIIYSVFIKYWGFLGGAFSRVLIPIVMIVVGLYYIRKHNLLYSRE